MQKVAPSRGYYRGNYYGILIYRLIIALFLFWLSRILFLLINREYFVSLTSGEIFHVLFTGLRYDLSALFMINLPFIVLISVPLPWRRKKIYRQIAGLLYYIPNLLAIALNIVDIVFFRFTRTRMTADIVGVVYAGMPMEEIIPQVLKDFWMYVLGFILFIVVFFKLTSFVTYSFRRFVEHRLWYYSVQIISFGITLLVSVFFIRGGFQLKPVDIISAAQYVKPEHFPLILNTPFTILKTINEKKIERVKYFEPEQLERIWSPVRHFSREQNVLADSVANRMNVVVIIVESLSAEHVGALNTHIKDYQGFTPFLDSLIAHSTVFEGYANAKTSINGIPAVVSSIPSLMDRSFIVSKYAGNSIHSLASLLANKGYYSCFFHGGTNGTLNLDHYARLAGFQKYFGRNEYGTDRDYDGQWGVFDEPFLLFTADKLNDIPEPFCSVIFTLSSHHPYRIPEKYAGKFRKGNLEIQESIMYADYALSQFFRKASSSAWFQRTLFVITADHASDTYFPEYRTKSGIYRIPIIFYSPGHRIPVSSNTIAAQTDILPSVMALVGYERPFVAFGNNIFDSRQQSFAVQYMNGIYQIIRGDYLLEFDGNKSLSLYNMKEDKLLQENILSVQPMVASDMENLLKAYIQQFINRMMDNQLVVQ